MLKYKKVGEAYFVTKAKNIVIGTISVENKKPTWEQAQQIQLTADQLCDIMEFMERIK